MNGRIGFFILLVLSPTLGSRSVRGDEPPPSPAGAATLQQPDGQRHIGKLVGDAHTGFRFAIDGSAQPARLETGASITFEGPGPDPTVGSPPFRIELGLDRRISGRLKVVNDDAVRLDDGSVSGGVTVARGGVRSILQRVGEMQILEEGFEALAVARWKMTGDPRIVGEPRVAGEHSLLIPAGGASVTCRLAEPVPSGRLELAFHDSGVVANGQQCFADLLFRGPAGPETVRAILGWSEESLSVESPGGPALAVQRLARKTGWHRLSIRFGADQTEIAVDGNDLAHGKGPGGPLIEIRLASHNAGKAEVPVDLHGHFDDLRLVRFSDSASGIEVDPSQDEVRLSGGDQVFGKLVDADADRIGLRVDNHDVTLPWSEVSGIYFRRVARQAQPVEGLLVRMEWRAAPGDDPIDLDRADGALIGLTEESITLDSPYMGRLTVARNRLRRLEVLGKGRRIVIDATAHHLGNEIVGNLLPLDPPQPEGSTLERTLELTNIPNGPAFLSLDVVQVAGEASGLRFFDLVKKGEVRTHVRLNDRVIDYLNRHITSKNETPERIRVPIPAGLLRTGTNRLRIEQVGPAADPNDLDDLGLLETAVEFPMDGAVQAVPEKP